MLRREALKAGRSVAVVGGGGSSHGPTFSECLAERTGKTLRKLRAGWITIGENDLHVEVNDKGDIERGPASLKGDPVNSLSDKSRNTERNARRAHALAEGRTGRDYTYKRKTRRATDLGTKARIDQFHSAKEAAKGQGLKTHEVLATMRDAHAFLTEQHSQREAAKDTARRLSGLNSSNVNKIEDAYRDHSTINRFDEAAQEVAWSHPELGFDPHGLDTPGKVWELIKEGKQAAPKLHDKIVADTAAEWLRDSKRRGTTRASSPAVGDAFDDWDTPTATPSKVPSRSRSADVVPFARSPGRDRLVASLAAGRDAVPVSPPAGAAGGAAAAAGARMTFADGAVKLRASAGKGKSFREFTGSAYNGGVMYPSVTVNGIPQTMAIVLDLDTLQIPQPERPVLDDHDETTDGVIGQTTMLAVRTSDYTLPVAGVLYTRKERSKKILDASDGGHRWQLSVGTENFSIEKIPAGQSVRVNQRTFHGPVSVARNAYLTDLSFVAVGGDDTTYAVIAARRAVQ